MMKKKKKVIPLKTKKASSIKIPPNKIQKRTLGRFWIVLILLSVLAFFYPGNGLYQHFYSYDGTQLVISEELQIDVPPFPALIDPQIAPAVSAVSAYVVDVATFTPVFQKNPHIRSAPASTTKVIAALVAFDAFDLHDELTVKRALPEGRIMNLVAGEVLTFEGLLYGLLVHSANDAAYAIADNYPGGFDKFIDAMNGRAEELHMKNSVFIDPAGLDRQGQYSSAFDLALAGRELLKNETLSSIVSTRSISISDVNFLYFHDLTNVNRLLGQIAGVGGLKTGQTPEAGENLITFYKKDGHSFLIVLMKSEDRFTDTENVVVWLDSNVRHITP